MQLHALDCTGKASLGECWCKSRGVLIRGAVWLQQDLAIQGSDDLFTAFCLCQHETDSQPGS